MGFSTRSRLKALSEQPTEPYTAKLSASQSGWIDVLDVDGVGYLQSVAHTALDYSALEVQHQHVDVEIAIDGGSWIDIGDPGAHLARGQTHDAGITPFPGLRFESNLSVRARGPGGSLDAVRVTALYSLEP